MREYKPTYFTSLLYFWAMMYLSLLPALILFDWVAFRGGHTSFGEIFWGAALVFCLCGAAFVLFVLLINLLIGLFVRKNVQLSDDSVFYNGKTIQIEKIRYVTLYLPEISKYASKPQTLTIWADNKTYMDIKRPSIALIAELKKRCVFAAFDIDDWKSHIKQCLWVQLGIFVLILVGIIFGVQ